VTPAELVGMTDAARRVRGRVLEMSHAAETAHLGSSLSCVDLLVAAYSTLRADPKNPDDPDRDRIILSKGHAVSALYATLAERGYISADELKTYNKEGGRLPEQPSPRCVPGVELATGSLGHGLCVGGGMALAARLQKKSYRVCVIMSDGECQEGSVWEAALFAAAQKLDRLVAIVDYNKLQATGRSNEIMALAPFKAKWQAFGWTAHEIDGHDVGAVAELLRKVPDGSGRPVAIVANTVKGKGVSFMEDDNNWHYLSPNEEHLRKAKAELGLP
jgi:transketolase